MNNISNPEKREKLLKVLEYSLPALISIFIYIFAMLCKGIAPFGEHSICYIDCSDGLIPAYTGLWDFLHGNSSFMVSFNLGTGGSLFSSFITNGFLSPISWLIGLVPRSKIIYGISFLIIVRFALMATTAYICFKKFFPQINKWILLLFTIIWTFSGWTMVHFTNIGWLDIIALFPLLILSFKKLVDDSKIFWFVLCLSYMLILSYYITYMVLVGIVIICTIYIFTICEKNNRKKIASLLFYGITISLLISFITFIPSMVTSLGGHRFTNTSSADKSQLYEYFFSKLTVIIMYSLPIVFFVRLMKKFKYDKKNVLFFMLSFIICSLGIIIEPINQMWHTGSYYCFPIRYGFLIIMILIFASLYYINTYLHIDQENYTTKNKLKYFNPSALIIPLFCCAIIAIIFVSILGINSDLIRPTNFITFIFYFLVFILTYTVIELSLHTKKQKLSFSGLNGGVFIFSICILQVVLLMIGYLGVPYINRGNTTARVENALLVDTTSLENGYKIKDREQLYNLNFPYLMNYASMSTWIHISSEEQYLAYSHMGYNTFSTTLYSSGGTYMTDLLLGNQYILSKEILDENYYIKIGEEPYINENTNKTEIVYLYEMKYLSKKAFTTSIDLTTLINNIEDPIEVQNKIYKELFNQSNNIITPISYNIEKVFVPNNSNYNEKFIITLNTPIGHSLYVKSSINGLKTYLNGNDKFIYNGLNDFSTKNNNITIEIPLDKDNSKVLEEYNLFDDLSQVLNFYSFDIDTFINTYQNFQTSDVELHITKNSLKINFNNSTNDKYLFVPFINLSNTNANINGSNYQVENALYNFMSIEIGQGQNTIEITYTPKLFKPCALITIISLIIFIIFSILNHFLNLYQKKIFIWIGTIGASLILFAVGFLVYIKPFFNTFIILFS